MSRSTRWFGRSAWLAAPFLWLLASVPALAQVPVAQVRAEADKLAAHPGDQIVVAVVMEFDEGWHAHTHEPKIPASWRGFMAIPTEIGVKAGPGVRTGAIQWPRPSVVNIDLGATGRPVPYEVYEGRSIAYVPVVIDPGASGSATVELDVSFQACNDTTCMAEEHYPVSVSIKLVGAGEPASPNKDAALFAGFDTTAFASLASGERPKSETAFHTNVFGWSISFDAGGWGLVLLLLVAVVGGFVLNLTPCVLPVIPLKIMGLSHSAGNPRRALYLGVVMAAGVVAFWLGIGLMMALVTGFRAVNQLFQIPWFTLGVGAFILVMALGMLGLFTVSLPGAVYLIDPKKESPAGSFLFGVMTAVLSTPCTAPFMASAAAWATKQPPWVTLLTFGAIGVGMALPYLVLAANPALVSRVPRSGPGSELVKQVMGLLMVGVAIFFLGTGIDPLVRLPVDEPVRFYWWIIAGAVVLAMGWMVWRVRSFKVSAGVKATLAGVALLLGVGILFFARAQTDRGPIDWLGYTPERFEKAVGERKVVVLDFTAEWCINCKTLEAAVLHREEVAKALSAPGVVAMRVDLTGNNIPGQAKLKELHWAGIPLLVIYGPGLPAPMTYDNYTPGMVLDALARARGGA